MDIYNFIDRKKDDTSEKVTFTFKDALGLAIDLTGATVKCQFRIGDKQGQLKVDLAIATGITIDDATGGVLSIDQIDPLDWAGGTYFYDVEITLADGRVKTYVGGTMKVVDTVTV